MANQRIDIIDFGSQYTQLIARKVRELNIYCEVCPYDTYKINSKDLRGVILSGSPFSVYAEGAPTFAFDKVLASVPILGICYGAQLFAKQFGGEIVKSSIREYGRANLNFVESENQLMQKISAYNFIQKYTILAKGCNC